MRGHFGAEIGGQFDAVKGGLFRRNFQLGLKNSIEHLAELAKKYPEASEMFAKYLHLSLNLVNIGYYERVAESALQYSERLFFIKVASVFHAIKVVVFLESEKYFCIFL